MRIIFEIIEENILSHFILRVKLYSKILLIVLKYINFIH